MTRVTLNSLPTEWRAWGDGDRPLLCLHPLGQEAAYFADLAAALGKGWRVASYDQRGHGAAADTPVGAFSDFVDDAESAMDRLGPCAVAGFSLGGAVAALLAARRAPRALILAATPHRGLPVFTERACAARSGGIEAVAQDTVHRWFGRTTADPATDRARTSLHRMTPGGYDAAWRAFATFEGYDRIAPHLPRTLALAYGDDLSTPPDILDTIARTIRDANGTVLRETIPGAGHMGLLDKPAETAAILVQFLESGA